MVGEWGGVVGGGWLIWHIFHFFVFFNFPFALNQINETLNRSRWIRCLREEQMGGYFGPQRSRWSIQDISKPFSKSSKKRVKLKGTIICRKTSRLAPVPTACTPLLPRRIKNAIPEVKLYFLFRHEYMNVCTFLNEHVYINTTHRHSHRHMYRQLNRASILF